SFPETEPVRRCRSEHEHAPTCEIVGQLELESAVAAAIELDRRVPVAHVLEHRAHAECGAAIAAGGRAFQVDLLPSHEPRQQAEVADVEAVLRIEARIRIEIRSAALNEIEHGLVEHRDSDL